MKKRPNPELLDEDSPEWTTSDFARARPASVVLPTSLQVKLGMRGAQKAPLKVPTTIRFDADVLAALKASGKGWQTRVNGALREWVKTHSPV